MPNEPPSSKTPAELRAQAHHARELARELLPNDELGRRLRRLADDLEAEASAGAANSVLTRLRGLGAFSMLRPLPINGLAGEVCTTAGCWERWLWRSAVMAVVATGA